MIELNNSCKVEERDGYTYISFIDNIDEGVLLKSLEAIWNYEIEQEEINIYTNIKNLSKELKISAFRMALSRFDLKDPLFILNIMNMARIYRVLDDMMFNQEDVFFNDSQELLDIKLAIKPELSEFRTELSRYLIAIFQSFPKVKFTPTDVVEEIPNIFKIIFMTTDLLTLCGILRVSNDFKISECPTVYNAFVYVSEIISKTSDGLAMMNEFLEEHKEWQ